MSRKGTRAGEARITIRSREKKMKKEEKGVEKPVLFGFTVFFLMGGPMRIRGGDEDGDLLLGVSLASCTNPCLT